MTTEGLYRTVVQVEVLSRGPLPDHMGIERIAYEIIEGDYSGDVSTTSQEQVDGPEMVKLLAHQGSDAAFLGLTEQGKEA